MTAAATVLERINVILKLEGFFIELEILPLAGVEIKATLWLPKK